MGAVALPVLSIGLLVVRASLSPDVPFISQSDGAPWIAPPFPVSAELRQWGRAEVPVAGFSRHFSSGDSDGAVLQLRALGSFAVSLNGAELPGARGDGSRWRDEVRVPLPIRAGDNELLVEVANRHGPPLLSARVDGIAQGLSTRAGWAVHWEGRPLGPAIIADDTRVNPLALVLETPSEALMEALDWVLLIFVLAALGYWMGGRFGGERLARFLPAVVVGVAGLGWGYLFYAKFLEIPLDLGFDARHHLYYVELLRQNHSVPLATDGWSVYHPPLFYVAAGLLEWLGEAMGGSRGGIVGLKLLPFLAGFGNVWLAGELCRRLCVGEAVTRFYALLFAAVLPMNIYSAAYFSNETFHTFIAGMAILASVDLLLAREVRTSRVLVLATLLGLCLITKFTGLLVSAVAGFFLLAKLFAVDRAAPRRALGLLGLVAVVGLAMAGWFYLRNWLHYGDPLMANWGDMPGPTLKWWQQPGFHTLAYYTGFGETLRHPYLSAFHSFWDSIYSTLWGDGGIGGRVSPIDRPSFWNYSFMSLGYLVALPATALIGVGIVGSLQIALRDPDPHRRAAFSFLLTLAYAVLFGLLYLSLGLPYFAQAKASYGLIAFTPLSVFFAMGAATCNGALGGSPHNLPRAVFHGWLGLFAVAMFFSYAA
jgi:hypothetical protein